MSGKAWETGLTGALCHHGPVDFLLHHGLCRGCAVGTALHKAGLAKNANVDCIGYYCIGFGCWVLCLPCGVCHWKTRRDVMAKYGIQENACKSCLVALYCWECSYSQIIVQIQKEENGQIVCGRWQDLPPKADVIQRDSVDDSTPPAAASEIAKPQGNSDTQAAAATAAQGSGGGGEVGLAAWVGAYPTSGAGPRPDQLKAYGWFEGKGFLGFKRKGWKDEWPLQHAAMKGDVERIKQLCSEGHDPNVKMTAWFDSEPLGWSASFGQLAATVALIQCGADPLRPANKAGNTPLEDAQRERHQTTVSFLEEYQRRAAGNWQEEYRNDDMCTQGEETKEETKEDNAIEEAEARRFKGNMMKKHKKDVAKLGIESADDFSFLTNEEWQKVQRFMSKMDFRKLRSTLGLPYELELNKPNKATGIADTKEIVLEFSPASVNTERMPSSDVIKKHKTDFANLDIGIESADDFSLLNNEEWREVQRVVSKMEFRKLRCNLGLPFELKTKTNGPSSRKTDNNAPIIKLSAAATEKLGGDVMSKYKENVAELGIESADDFSLLNDEEWHALQNFMSKMDFRKLRLNLGLPLELEPLREAEPQVAVVEAKVIQDGVEATPILEEEGNGADRQQQRRRSSGARAGAAPTSVVRRTSGAPAPQPEQQEEQLSLAERRKRKKQHNVKTGQLAKLGQRKNQETGNEAEVVDLCGCFGMGAPSDCFGMPLGVNLTIDEINADGTEMDDGLSKTPRPLIMQPTFQRSGDKRVAFLSHRKAEVGSEARTIKNDVLTRYGHRWGIHQDHIFLDSDNLSDLTVLLQEVERTEHLVVLLTSEYFISPWCLLELFTAVKNNVNIVPVRILGLGARVFDFNLGNKFKEDFVATLKEQAPKSADDILDELESFGVTPADMEDCIAQLMLKIIMDLEMSKSLRLYQTMLDDIADKILKDSNIIGVDLFGENIECQVM